MRTVAVLGTFDTKGVEHAYVAERIRERGCGVVMIDVGGLGEPQCEADIDAEQVAGEAGLDLGGLRARADRGAMIEGMARAACLVLSRLVATGHVQAVISLGGSGGTAIATAAMRALPLGIPKVVVSTLAGGNVGPYVGDTDIVLMPSIVDVAGLNRFSRGVFRRAAGAVCGMVEADAGEELGSRPLIVASMFGNTTACVQRAREKLDASGYEVLVFHATGAGGRVMESLIESGMVAGVLDITTTEWADEVVGGVLSAGPRRLEAAARRGVPSVVCPGCLDMVNFGAPDTVPQRFSGRQLYSHNPQVTLMRTNVEESAVIGRVVAEKVSLSTGPVTVLIPLKGVSAMGEAGQPFHDPVADQALFKALKHHLRADIPVVEIDAAINESAFADACVMALFENMRRSVETT